MLSIRCNSYEKVRKNPGRMSKIKPVIDKHNLEGINFPSKKDDWEKFEKNHLELSLNVLYAKNEKI